MLRKSLEYNRVYVRQHPFYFFYYSLFMWSGYAPRGLSGHIRWGEVGFEFDLPNSTIVIYHLRGEGGNTLPQNSFKKTFPGPMRSFTVKENHTSGYRDPSKQTDTDPVTFL